MMNITFYVFWEGDLSVGICGEEEIVTINQEYQEEDDNSEDMIDFFRESLMQYYDTDRVFTPKEYDEYEREVLGSLSEE